MTPQEFKAWFDGFTEAFDNRVPTKAQWTRVKERVAEIDGKPVTERVFVDRYYPSYPSYYWYSAAASTAYSAAASRNNVMLCGSSYDTTSASVQATNAFSSSAAMAALGRADAKALKN